MHAAMRCTDFTQSQAHSPSVSGFFWVIILHSLSCISHVQTISRSTKYTLKPKTSHVPHGYPNLSHQHLSAGLLEERSIFLLHYWWLSAQKLNRCIKSNLGSHDCIVWIFKQRCVAEKQICSSLHHLWKALHGGSPHHLSNHSFPTIFPLIMLHSLTLAPFYKNIRLFLQNVLVCLAHSAFCSEWFLFWETNPPVAIRTSLLRYHSLFHYLA